MATADKTSKEAHLGERAYPVSVFPRFYGLWKRGTDPGWLLQKSTQDLCTDFISGMMASETSIDFMPDLVLPPPTVPKKWV